RAVHAHDGDETEVSIKRAGPINPQFVAEVDDIPADSVNSIAALSDRLLFTHEETDETMVAATALDSVPPSTDPETVWVNFRHWIDAI
ncbi:MAG: hypothetical protein ABGZ35_23765, partial [Planctomycetaceae bacterium]